MLRASQIQKLTAKLSPQQIQYIKLLQLPTIALEQRIKSELESNPVLEEGIDEEEEDEVTTEAEASAEEKSPEEKLEEKDREEDYDWDELINSADDLYGYKAQVDRSSEEEARWP